jgi:hypothetical protein
MGQIYATMEGVKRVSIFVWKLIMLLWEWKEQLLKQRNIETRNRKVKGDYGSCSCGCCCRDPLIFKAKNIEQAEMNTEERIE